MKGQIPAQTKVEASSSDMRSLGPRNACVYSSPCLCSGWRLLACKLTLLGIVGLKGDELSKERGGSAVEKASGTGDERDVAWTRQAGVTI